MARICLVACVGQKASKRSKAKELYTSPLFKKAREFAERQFDRWYILSAKYGLVDPESAVEPYEKSLNTMRRDDRVAWAQEVFARLARCTGADDEITFLAGKNYRADLVPMLADRGNPVCTPMEGLGIGRQLQWLTLQNQAATLETDLDRFYKILGQLERSLGGKRVLAECDGTMDWPQRGVYFFFENGEFRSGAGDQPRVVRVGTHMVSRGSKSTFWHRLHTHRGTEDGRGNHRGSIFRLHVGNALMNRSDGKISVPTWAQGQSASADTRAKEDELERRVSEHIGAMPLLWLSVPDEAGPSSDRAYIERNAIGLLSNDCQPLDTPSQNWLGRHSSSEAIRGSGLWNVNHVLYRYDRRFLKILSIYVDAQDGKHTVPAQSIAPRDWYLADKGRDVRGQMTFFDEREHE
jgi:hypothetical protein